MPNDKPESRSPDSDITIPLPGAGPPLGGHQEPYDQIGPYQLIEVLGEGGMGTVHLAEQHTPIRRRVAIKVIKLGMDTKEVVSRFQAERQALAIMDHPGVARVIEAGATEQGRPYFVMDLVDGEPITAYCDRHRLSINERLMLFEQVCDAIQHAHQKGIIHRDLKPSNVLVADQSGEPAPKVIDFGIAKATAGSQPKATLTHQGALIGTPDYMSPEQASGSMDVDTRTDVYALGVMLYELLTGTLPLELKREAGLGDLQEKIQKTEPRRPSAQVTAVVEDIAAQRRNTDHRTLTRLLRGDLDWITMKALEKDRNRRYDSPAALAADLRRYLKNEPVEAGPPSNLYRTRKFVRRHRIGVAMAAAIGGLLIAGIVGTTSGLLKAREEARKSQQVTDMMSEMLRGAGPSAARGRDTQILLDMIAHGDSTWPRRLAGNPEGEADLRMTVGLVQLELGDGAEAERHFRRALDLYRLEFGDHDMSVAIALRWLGNALDAQGHREEGERLNRQAVTLSRELLAEDDPDLAVMLSSWANRLPASEAESVHREVLAIERKAFGEDTDRVANTLSRLANDLSMQGKYLEAERFNQNALDMRRRSLGEDAPLVALSLARHAKILVGQHRCSEAESAIHEAIDLGRRVLGEEHPDVAKYRSTLADVLNCQGRYEESEQILLEVVEKKRQSLGDDHPSVASSLALLATVVSNQGRFGEAEVLNREALNIQLKFSEENHPSVIALQANLGYNMLELGKHDEAEEILTKALASSSSTLGEEHSLTGRLLVYLGACMSQSGDLKKAETYLIEGHRTVLANSGADSRDTQYAVGALVNLFESRAQTDPDAGYEATAEEWRARLGK